MGGLAMMIKFSCLESCNNFVCNLSLWQDWFSPIDRWSGQSLPFERIAWLKVVGVPIHLAADEMYDSVARKFGKIVHGSHRMPEDVDLSSICIGILRGDGVRVAEEVVLTWKDKRFKVWVEEVSEEWLPECLEEEGVGSEEEKSTEEGKSSEFQVDRSEVEKVPEDGQTKSAEVLVEDVHLAALLHGEGSLRVKDNNCVFNKENFKGGNPEVFSAAQVPLSGGGVVPQGPVLSDNIPVKKKKPFNLFKDKHLRKPIMVSPPSNKRPAKRSRRESEEPKAFSWPDGLNINRGNSEVSRNNLWNVQPPGNGDNPCQGMVEDGAQKGPGSVPESVPETQVLGSAFPKGMEDFNREVEATIDLGKKVGVALDDHSSRIKEVLLGEAIQETKAEDLSNFNFEKIWGNKKYGMEFVGSVGNSGGILSLWNSGIFELETSIKRRNLLALRGKLKGSGEVINIINVYAPQSSAAKSDLWKEILVILGGWDGCWVMVGDFNAVRDASERKNSGFKAACAKNFNEFIAQANLLEFDMKGFRFTCSRENGKKPSKLDRIMVCSEFFNRWSSVVLRALSFLYSDHCPLILEVGDKNFGPKPFRVFDVWMGKDGFCEAVELAASSSSISGPPDRRLTEKFANIRRALKEWRDNYSKKESEEVSCALEEVEKLESCLEVRDLSEEEDWVLAENRKVILDAELRKCSEAKQRARVKWASEGDANTKFFHSLVNQRKASNNIPGLIIDGRWESKPTKVKKEIMSFFRNRFREEWVDRPQVDCEGTRVLGEADKTSLTQRFSVEEIKAAVSECGSDKSPGPDGLNFGFIKKFWHLFEKDFIKVFDSFFINGVFSMGCGSSFITLVPKIKDPVELKNYRPINLIGVISKVVSMVLANRLKKVIGSVVSESQSAFLEGNYILDGPLIVNEILRWGNKFKKKGFFFKIDFEKAYDNVNWNFLLDTMSKKGFPDRWCLWIKGILQSARSSVLVNGSPTFEFQCFKGMRQGDPISPFLFILVMDVLSGMLERAKNEGSINGLVLPNNGPFISHLFYADDAIIIGEWSKENIANVVRTLRIFHLCSGLKINLDKSSLFGMGVRSEEMLDMASFVGCNSGSFPFCYLGLKVGANMNRVVNWDVVYKIFDARLSSWKAALLSIGGRVTLIKSVLESLPNYYFSLYKAPSRVISDLEAKIRRFLWGGNEEIKKLH
ncbi:putative RNA-directed DNA polymerase [Helianthus annuus]|nr:putative RNA-directed DNA polymerase [Helianthus annuus]